MSLNANVGTVVLGIVFSATVLLCGYFLSHDYSVSERRERAEAERNRLEDEKRRFQEAETYRSKIAKIIESYAIHLTNMTSRSVISPSSKHSTRQIPTGNDKDDEIPPVESISITSDSSSEDPEDVESSSSTESIDDDDDESITGEAREYEGATTIRSTLTIDQLQKDAECIPSSSVSIATTMTRVNLREAVRDDPCPICLEPFQAGDDIVCCSNNGNGKRPHVFHQACALDYVINHTDGIEAPCPMCRKVLLPPEEKERKGCLKSSHNSALTLPELAVEPESGESDSDDNEDSDTQSSISEC